MGTCAPTGESAAPPIQKTIPLELQIRQFQDKLQELPPGDGSGGMRDQRQAAATKLAKAVAAGNPCKLEAAIQDVKDRFGTDCEFPSKIWTDAEASLKQLYKRACVAKTWQVQMLSGITPVSFEGQSLGDLRRALQGTFGFPPFEQTIVYIGEDGSPQMLTGDDTVLIIEKPGLQEASTLMLSRQVDPRHKMEKETSFLDALAACRFADAKEILDSSGVAIDPDVVHKCDGMPEWHKYRLNNSDCPVSYRHPALTAAMMAGYAKTVGSLYGESHMQEFMSYEPEVVDIVERLIAKRADVNAIGDETCCCDSGGSPTVQGKTPLCAAVQRGSPTLVRILLDAKADPNHGMTYFGSAYGPYKGPWGDRQLRPESWLNDISNGSVSRRGNDPRAAKNHEILELLRAAGAAEPPGRESER